MAPRSARKRSSGTCINRSRKGEFRAEVRSAEARNYHTTGPQPGTRRMAITLKINGKSTTVDAPADMPLLWVLRDVVDLKGTKFGCGIGQCGACTVHVNGQAARSCQRKVGSLQGAEVTTIEGLSPDGQHPLQRAWEELDV